MIVYVDSSVVLRVVLRAAGSLSEWNRIDRFVSSALLSVECLRTIHRLHVFEPLADDELAERIEATEKVLANVELVGLDRIVLERASGSFALPVKTLDAIHLATAILWREREQPDVVFATHDKQFGLAARASGFPVIGV